MGRQLRKKRMQRAKRTYYPKRAYYQGRAPLSIPVPKAKTAGMILGAIIGIASSIFCVVVLMSM